MKVRIRRRRVAWRFRTPWLHFSSYRRPYRVGLDDCIGTFYGITFVHDTYKSVTIVHAKSQGDELIKSPPINEKEHHTLIRGELGHLECGYEFTTTSGRVSSADDNHTNTPKE